MPKPLVPEKLKAELPVPEIENQIYMLVAKKINKTYIQEKILQYHQPSLYRTNSFSNYFDESARGMLVSLEHNSYL